MIRKNSYLSIISIIIFFYFLNPITFQIHHVKADSEPYIQTTYYRYGIFDTGGLSITDKFPDMTKIGTTSVNLDGHSYNITIIPNHAGDLITLKDGSKWYYLTDDSQTIKLLSMYPLKEVDNNILEQATSFDGDDTIFEVLYSDKFEKKEDNGQYTYINYLDAYFKPNFVKSFSNVSLDDINVDLPDASLLSEITGAELSNVNDSNWHTGSFKNGKSFISTRIYSSNFPYWTKNSTNRNGTFMENGRYVWVVNSKLNDFTLYAKNNEKKSIRPQLTVSISNFEKMVKLSNDYSYGILDYIESLNYLIYDVENEKILRKQNNIDPQWINGLDEGSTYYWGPNTTDYVYPASITKLSTISYALYLLNDYAQKNNIPLEEILDTKITVSDCISDYMAKKWNTHFIYEKDNNDEWTGKWEADNGSGKPSTTDINSGDIVTYRDLIYGALYPSGADATMQLAISLFDLNLLEFNQELPFDENSANHCIFVDRLFSKAMTNYARNTIKVSDNTYYVNSWGNIEKDSTDIENENTEHRTTMEDIAKIMAYSMKNINGFREIYDNNKTEKIINAKYIINVTSNEEENHNRKIILARNFPEIETLGYYVGGKGGSALGQINGKRIHSGINSAVYLEQDNNHHYIVVTIGATGNISNKTPNRIRSADHMYIHQWLFPGQLEVSKDNNNNLLGDMNKNGRIDLADIIMLLKVYLNGNPTNEELRIGDMSGNDSIGLNDIILLLKVYLGV